MTDWSVPALSILESNLNTTTNRQEEGKRRKVLGFKCFFFSFFFEKELFGRMGQMFWNKRRVSEVLESAHITEGTMNKPGTVFKKVRKLDIMETDLNLFSMLQSWRIIELSSAALCCSILRSKLCLTSIRPFPTSVEINGSFSRKCHEAKEKSFA